MMKTTKKSEKQAKGKETKVFGKKVGKAGVKRGLKAKKGNPDPMATFRQNIMVRKRELEEALEHLMNRQREYDVQLNEGQFKEDFDRAQREISVRSDNTLIERKIRELKKIELLIARMSEEKTFGSCEECGKSIPKRRLLVLPDATLCVPCQEELEKHYRRSIMAGTSPDLGGSAGMRDWQTSPDLQDKGYNILKPKVTAFSVSDIEGTEPDHSFDGGNSEGSTARPSS